MLMIDGGGRKEGGYFDRGFLGDWARLIRCLCHAYLEEFATDGCTQSVLDIIRIKKLHHLTVIFKRLDPTLGYTEWLRTTN